MALLDIIIETLRINCSVVQCTGYASEIEALFYLFFFPTVFIILLVYILTNFIFRGEGNTPRGLRLLVSVTFYAFIIMEGLYTMFVSLSRFWWLFAVILLGLWAFIRHLIGGGGNGGGGGSGKMPSIGRGLLRKVARAADLDLNLDVIKQAGDIHTINDIIEKIEKEIKVQEDLKSNAREDRERAVYAHKISELEDAKKVAEIKLKDLKRLRKVE